MPASRRSRSCNLFGLKIKRNNHDFSTPVVYLTFAVSLSAYIRARAAQTKKQIDVQTGPRCLRSIGIGEAPDSRCATTLSYAQQAFFLNTELKLEPNHEVAVEIRRRALEWKSNTFCNFRVM